MFKYYVLLALIAISQSLFCMESTQLLSAPPTLVRDIIVSNIIHLSHDEVCAWALVNKDYNKAIQKTVELRKKHLKYYALKQDPLFNNTQVTWHKNGSAYTYVLVNQKNKEGTFKLVYLANNDIPQEKNCCTYMGNRSPYPSSDRYHPSFNYKGDAYFYAIGRFTAPNNHPSINIIEYTLLTKSYSAKINRCMIDLNDKRGKPVNLIALLHFPTLLQAFLQSTQVREGLTHLHTYYPDIDVNDKAKIYSIKGVTIPDDYNTYKEYPAWSVPFKSFDAFSADSTIIRIKNAVIKRYNKQLKASKDRSKVKQKKQT